MRQVCVWVAIVVSFGLSTNVQAELFLPESCIGAPQKIVGVINWGYSRLEKLGAELGKELSDYSAFLGARSICPLRKDKEGELIWSRRTERLIIRRIEDVARILEEKSWEADRIWTICEIMAGPYRACLMDLSVLSRYTTNQQEGIKGLLSDLESLREASNSFKAGLLRLMDAYRELWLNYRRLSRESRKKLRLLKKKPNPIGPPDKTYRNPWRNYNFDAPVKAAPSPDGAAFKWF